MPICEEDRNHPYAAYYTTDNTITITCSQILPKEGPYSSSGASNNDYILNEANKNGKTITKGSNPCERNAVTKAAKATSDKAAADKKAVADSQRRTYTVKSGDTCDKIIQNECNVTPPMDATKYIYSITRQDAQQNDVKGLCAQGPPWLWTKDVIHYTCSPRTTADKDAADKDAADKAKTCSDYTCSAGYTLKAGAGSITGHTDEACCNQDTTQPGCPRACTPSGNPIAGNDQNGRELKGGYCTYWLSNKNTCGFRIDPLDKSFTDYSETDCTTCTPPPVDCVVSDWGSYNKCSKTDGECTRSRDRSVLTAPQYGGSTCPPLHTFIPLDCTNNACQNACICNQLNLVHQPCLYNTWNTLWMIVDVRMVQAEVRLHRRPRRLLQARLHTYPNTLVWTSPTVQHHGMDHTARIAPTANHAIVRVGDASAKMLAV